MLAVDPAAIKTPLQCFECESLRTVKARHIAAAVNPKELLKPLARPEPSGQRATPHSNEENNGTTPCASRFRSYFRPPAANCIGFQLEKRVSPPTSTFSGRRVINKKGRPFPPSRVIIRKVAATGGVIQTKQASNKQASNKQASRALSTALSTPLRTAHSLKGAGKHVER